MFLPEFQIDALISISCSLPIIASRCMLTLQGACNVVDIPQGKELQRIIRIKYKEQKV